MHGVTGTYVDSENRASTPRDLQIELMVAWADREVDGFAICDLANLLAVQNDVIEAQRISTGVVTSEP